jgi:peroxiredoxin family protein
LKDGSDIRLLTEPAQKIDLGLKREDLIDELDEPAGATKALADAQGAITLFI